MKVNIKFYYQFLLTAFGVLMLLIRYDVQEYLYIYLPKNSANIYGLAYTVASAIVLLLGSTRFVFDYLQGKFSSNRLMNTELDDKINEIEDRVSKLTDLGASEEKIGALVEEKINRLTTDNLLSKIEASYGKSIIEKIKIDAITKELKEIKLRLDTETKRIARNSNLNLALGFATTVIAISYLSYSLLSTDSRNEALETELVQAEDIKSIFYLYLIKFLPRLSVSIFIELFSFFFLRIYKRNLEDIKYLNNERTNIELKLLSLNTAVTTNNNETLSDNETLKAILLELVKTERNFILKKDESTVELEKVKTESNVYKDTLDNVAKILKKG